MQYLSLLVISTEHNFFQDGFPHRWFENSLPPARAYLLEGTPRVTHPKEKNSASGTLAGLSKSCQLNKMLIAFMTFSQLLKDMWLPVPG